MHRDRVEKNLQRKGQIPLGLRSAHNGASAWDCAWECAPQHTLQARETRSFMYFFNTYKQLDSHLRAPLPIHHNPLTNCQVFPRNRFENVDSVFTPPSPPSPLSSHLLSPSHSPPSATATRNIKPTPLRLPNHLLTRSPPLPCHGIPFPTVPQPSPAKIGS